MAVRVGELKDSSMIARRIADYPYYLCASPDYLRSAGTPKTPEDLADHGCIVNAHLSPTGQGDFVVDGERRHVSVPVIAKFNTARATATLVRHGRGIGLCLSSTVRADLEAGRLVRLLEDFEAYDRSVYAIYPHSRHLSAKVRAFVEHLLQSFADHRRR